MTFATRLAVAGLVLLAAALSASAYFVTAFVFDDTGGALIAAVAAAVLGGLWFVLPLARKARDS